MAPTFLNSRLTKVLRGFFPEMGLSELFLSHFPLSYA